MQKAFQGIFLTIYFMQKQILSLWYSQAFNGELQVT